MKTGIPAREPAQKLPARRRRGEGERGIFPEFCINLAKTPLFPRFNRAHGRAQGDSKYVGGTGEPLKYELTLEFFSKTSVFEK
ncbi:MAG: hypothetical protein FWH38_00905 [Treponema sp.]|nr:hypothetical protein [Treponema sp.]